MSQIYQLPNVSGIEREASDWIARLNADDVSAQDRERFEAWHSAHPLHARAYAELLGTWRDLTAAGPFVRAVSFAASVTDIAPKRTKLKPRALLTAAASLVIVAVLSLLYVTKQSPDTTYHTAIGEHASITLPDGSTLELNSNSAARVAFSQTARVILLERGEAFFSVTHDTHRPFWVVGGGSWVRAVGTAFDVNLRATDVVVTVSEGTVKVGAADSSAGDLPSDASVAKTPTALVTAGQQAELSPTVLETRRLSSTEIAHSVGWREGTLYFENQPLREVVEELSRYTTLTIELEDKELGDLAIGGTFQAGPEGAEAMLSMLQQGFGIKIRRDGDRAYIQESPARRRNREEGRSL